MGQAEVHMTTPKTEVPAGAPEASPDSPQSPPTDGAKGDAKPQPKASKSVAQQVAEARSKADSQVALAHKERDAATKLHTDSQAELSRLNRAVELFGEADEDAGSRVKRIAEHEEGLGKREERVRGLERTRAATILSDEHGIPVEDLQDLPNLEAMEIKALRFALDHRDTEGEGTANPTAATGSEEPPKEPTPPGEQPGNEQPAGSGFDAGDSLVGVKPISEQSKEEFEATGKRLDRDYRRQHPGGRR